VSLSDLYLDKINFHRYIHHSGCMQCGFPSCDAFIDALRAGTSRPRDCTFISRNKVYALDAIQKIKELWPDVPLLTHPRPSFTGLVELNKPDRESLVLLSGNNEYTEQVLLTVLGTTLCPFSVLFVDTDGNTVDMAMIYHTLTAERIQKAIITSGVEAKVNTREMIIPGLAGQLKEEIEILTGWQVRVGPVCAAELPLFLSDIWIPPDTI
jgi:CO dehydrogenase/acetyl-CoA synthase gamma subunit (corrinoid Fe-S protein)